jgi:hypothetical protein
VTARVDGAERVVGMSVRPGVDRDCVRPGLDERSIEILEARIAFELRRQVGAALDRAAPQAADLEAASLW